MSGLYGTYADITNLGTIDEEEEPSDQVSQSLHLLLLRT